MPDHPTEDPPSSDERGRVIPFARRFAPAATEREPLSPEVEARIAEMAAMAAEQTMEPHQAELRRTLASLDLLQGMPRSAGPARPTSSNLKEELERAFANIASAHRLANAPPDGRPSRIPAPPRHDAGAQFRPLLG